MQDRNDQDYTPRTVGFRAKKIVLVIDDDPDILEVAVDCLSGEEDVRAIMASSAQEAVALLQRFPVDAILTDIQLPEMTGLQFLEHVRSLGYATPFVVMSGYVDRERALQAMRLGVSDILEKPFTQTALRESLVRALNVGSAIRRVQEDFSRFCGERALDLRYIDILSYMGIFLAQEEQRRFKEAALRSPDVVPLDVEMVPPVVEHEFDAFTYTGTPDLNPALELEHQTK